MMMPTNDHAIAVIPQVDGATDITAVLPFDVLVHILELGAFSPTDLAPIRAVNHAMREAASVPSLYRSVKAMSPTVPASPSPDCLANMPSYAASSVVNLSVTGGSYQHHYRGDLNATRFPCLTSLDCELALHEDAVGTLPTSLQALRLTRYVVDGMEPVGRLDRLEFLSLNGSHRLATLPVASLSQLRRLQLYGKGDLAQLFEALVSSPCASTIEAVDVVSSVGRGAGQPPMWWAPLAELPALRELRLSINRRMMAAHDSAPLVDLLGTGFDQLNVLALTIGCTTFGRRLSGHPLPPNLHTCRLSYAISRDNMDRRGIEAPALPASLRALRIGYAMSLISADTAEQVLGQCPMLSILSADLSEAASELVGSFAGPDGRKVLVATDGTPVDAMTLMENNGVPVVATEQLDVGIDWKEPGGLIVADRNLLDLVGDPWW